MTPAQQVAHRYAAVLTKEWLMGVRRTWVKLMDPPIGDWDDVHRAYKNLALFIKNLTDQVFYARRGPYTGTPTMSEGKKVLDLFGKLAGAVDDLKSKAKHWQDVHEGKTPAGGGFRQEEGEQMLNLYRTDFPGASDFSLEASPGKWRNASLTELMDKAFKILREDAARIKDHDERHPNDPLEDTSVYKEFDLHGMKVVIDDSTLLPSEIKEYIKYFDEAYQRLKQKGFGKIWYGTLFVKCKDCGGVNQYGPELGVAGNYPIGPDVVNVFSRPSKFIVDLLAHELGHRYWFKLMSPAQRGKFEDLIDIRPKPPLKQDTLIPDSKASNAKAMVDSAYDTLKRLLKDFGSSRLKWWADIIKKFDDEMFRASWQATQDIITAINHPGAWIDDPEIKKLHAEAIEASQQVSKRFSDMASLIKNKVFETPEPAATPESHNAYWLAIFKPIQKAWIEDTQIMIEGAITNAYLYIDASVKSFNDNEKARQDQIETRWYEKYKEMEKRVSPVTNYGGKHIDEAFAEAFAHYVTGEDMTRDQIESFKSVLKTSSLVDRYKAAFATITKNDVERWRKDLRVMTKIYKSIGLEGTEEDLARWDEGIKLFRTFHENFEHWAYKILLPKVEKGREPYLYKDIQKEVWDALFYIRTDELFPTAYDYRTQGRNRAPWELKGKRDKFIARYQRAFNKALKTIEDFIGDKTLERHTDEKYEVAGMSVLVTGYGRSNEHDREREDDIDKFLRNLRTLVQPVVQAGFKDAVQGMRVVLDFDPKPGESLTSAQYSPAEDRMRVYALGLAGNLAQVGGSVAHELGHRYWFKRMTSQERNHWEDVMSGQGAKIDQSDIDAFYKFVMSLVRGNVFPEDELLQQIKRLPVSEITKAKYRDLTRLNPYAVSSRFDPVAYRKTLDIYEGNDVLIEDITEYAASGGPIEAFAEVFRIYATKGPGALGPFTLDLFKRVVASGGLKLAARSKKIPLGFRVVDTRSGESLSEIFSRRQPARDKAKELTDAGRNVGVQTLEAYVPSDWKKGDPLEPYVEPEILEALKNKKVSMSGRLVARYLRR